MNVKFCLDCESKIVGRADKKFCNDACRNNFNNRQNSDINARMRNINYALRRNRRILSNILSQPSKRVQIQGQNLIALGFSFEFFTHIQNTKSGNVNYYCYEFGYRKLENGNCLILKSR